MKPMTKIITTLSNPLVFIFSLLFRLIVFV
jgi:hypothetical protein